MWAASSTRIAFGFPRARGTATCSGESASRAVRTALSSWFWPVAPGRAGRSVDLPLPALEQEGGQPSARTVHAWVRRYAKTVCRGSAEPMVRVGLGRAPHLTIGRGAMAQDSRLGKAACAVVLFTAPRANRACAFTTLVAVASPKWPLSQSKWRLRRHKQDVA